MATSSENEKKKFKICNDPFDSCIDKGLDADYLTLAKETTASWRPSMT